MCVFLLHSACRCCLFVDESQTSHQLLGRLGPNGSMESALGCRVRRVLAERQWAAGPRAAWEAWEAARRLATRVNREPRSCITTILSPWGALMIDRCACNVWFPSQPMEKRTVWWRPGRAMHVVVTGRRSRSCAARAAAEETCKAVWWQAMGS